MTIKKKKIFRDIIKEVKSKGVEKMEQDIYFMPLGGGQRVGASSYYLKLGTANLLLGAGVVR